MIKTKYVNDFGLFYEEHKNFIHERYDEASALCNTTRPLDIDVALYQQLVDLGYAVVLEIYNDEDFIGYCSIAISPAVLSVGNVDAKVDHLALSKDAREKGFATEVLKQIEEFLEGAGVDEVMLVFPDTELHKKFAVKNGYKESIILCIKELRSK